MRGSNQIIYKILFMFVDGKLIIFVFKPQQVYGTTRFADQGHAAGR